MPMVNSFAVILAVFVVVLVLLFWLPRFLAAQQRYSDEDAPVEKRVRSSTEIPAEWTAEIDRVQLEMYGLLRDFKGEIDTKLVALQALIQQAEITIARLEQAVDRAERGRDV